MRYFLTIIVLFVSTNAFAQKIEDYLNYYEQGNIERIRADLPLLESKFGEDRELLFLKALLESDGESAFELFNDLYSDNTNTDNIYPAVLWRLCEYHYAKGLYVTCNELVTEFLGKFEYTIYGDKAIRMQRSLQTFLGDQAKVPEVKQVPVESGPAFSIQIGAFASQVNVNRRLEYFQKLGISNAGVHESNIGGRKLFKILVGNFRTRDEARTSGEELVKKYRLRSFTIVEKENK